MGYEVMNYDQGHWLLAKMGKKVLRPGGRLLSENLIKKLNINIEADVVEFAPGIGITTKLTLKNNPKSFTGVEINRTAAKKLMKQYNNGKVTIINKGAADSGLKESSISKVYGEAMLTMQADHRKSEIIGEAHRILKSGGLYGIHELALFPDDLHGELKRNIQLGLAKAIKVNARPLTIKEWRRKLEEQGFEVIEVMATPFALLDPKRILEDEGFFRTSKIAFNILTHPKERKRIREMKAIFESYKERLKGVAMIARKK